ncbi:ABC transporter substrate-binding protein [Bacillus sp. FSL K6-3431]|uniref:ABC transporter substrate-binding protein n=1 Tax=Bacillus sp. FSL K6-3431 TaxID=2921500 RepID=UPI0030FA448C
MKKVLSFILAVGLVVSALAACSSKEKKGETKDGKTTIEFWAAPNPAQEAYWKEIAKNFEAENPDIKVNVSPMKESPTSEAGIQSALAAKQAPTISENINRGFAAQLAESKALIPLNELNGWDEIISSRNMTETIKSWKFSDGNQYVLPIYSNSMLFGWRLDILKELGYDEAPKTYNEVLDVTRKLKEKYPDKYLWAKTDLADPTAWKRWFDFFMLYNAASDGNAFIEGDTFIGDEDAGVKVLTFVDEIRKEKGILAKQVSDPFETGVGIFTDLGPWTFSYWEEKFPELKYGENFTLSLPPVPDGVDPEKAKTFADTKGLVVYANATKEQQKAAMTFIHWVYANPENDMKWLEKTNLPPARDDLADNEEFIQYFKDNPVLKPYAEAVPLGVPPMDNSKFNELQTYIGQDAFNKIVNGEISPEKGWGDMKKAIEGDLK